jgi:hypothetical protein
MLTREVTMNPQVKSKVQYTQMVGKEISPIFRQHPRVQDEITLVVPAEAVAISERGVSCPTDIGEDCLNQDLLADYLH